MPKIKKNSFLIKENSQNNKLKILQKTIKINFKNLNLLKNSLTHSSYVNESHYSNLHNERLEYLGDSILSFVINEFLYKNFKEYSEGELAKIKAVVVSQKILAKISRKLQLGDFLYLGWGEEQSGGRERTSILANTLEALIGAIYLDSGLRKCRNFILSYFKEDINRIDNQSSSRDPKTALQEYVQKKIKGRPIYNLVKETGPDHQKNFLVELLIRDKKILSARGSSKRKAEMEAAKKALEKIEEKGLAI